MSYQMTSNISILLLLLLAKNLVPPLLMLLKGFCLLSYILLCDLSCIYVCSIFLFLSFNLP